MSSAASAPHGAHDHGAHGHGHGHDDHGHHPGGASHGSFKGYMTGFVLSVILTVVPFWLVMGLPLPSRGVTAAIVMALALVQVIVHVVYFLHLDAKSEGGWNFLATVFTVVLVVITLSGSLWVMYHMNANMMPMPAQDMAAQRLQGDTTGEGQLNEGPSIPAASESTVAPVTPGAPHPGMPHPGAPYPSAPAAPPTVPAAVARES